MRNLINLYIFELKQNRRSLILWIVIIAVTMLLYMSIFPSMSSSDFMEIVNAKINAFPKGLVKTFGISGSSGASFQNVFYFFSYMFQFFVIVIIIYAINLGSNILSKENTEKHIDYLATKPIKKSYIIMGKYKALATYLIFMSVIIFALSFVIIQIFNKQDILYTKELATLFVKLFIVYLFFGTLAFFFSAISKKTSKTNVLVIGLFFTSYLTGVASGLVPSLSKLKYLSPYFMFQTDIASAGFSKTDITYLIILVILSIIMLVASIWRYKNKDLSL